MEAANNDGPRKERGRFRPFAKARPPFGRSAKRVFDLVAAVTSLLVLAPLILIVCVAIKLNSCGPIFVREPAYGCGGKAIGILQFRTTMDCAGGKCSGPSGTFVGRVLRRTGIEQLPQLINVLRGDLSVTGPRPRQGLSKGRLIGDDIRPGMTGWPSLAEPDHQHSTEAKNWSLVQDIKVILRSVHRSR